MTESMHSLAFCVRHAEDMFNLLDEGRDTPQETDPADWNAVWAVYDRCLLQANAVFESIRTTFEAELGAAGIRYKHFTRDTTARGRWEGWGRVFPARARKEIAHLGANIGADRHRPHELSVWWGYAQARGIRGPRLAERLRSVTSEARLSKGRDGWFNGTVVLASLDLATPRTLADCVDLARRACTLIIQNHALFLES